MSNKRSIGSLETYEAEDKTFTKHVLQPGGGDVKPNEGSVINATITPLGEYTFGEGALGQYVLGEEVEVTIGEGDTVISELLDSVVLTMIEGESAYVKTKLDINGERSTDLGLDKSCIKFNISLRSLSRAADMSELEPDELLERATHHKDRGTELYRTDRTQYSLMRFEKSLLHLTSMEPLPDSLPHSLSSKHAELKCQCYNNMAACYLKLERYDDVIVTSSQAMECGGENVKALFRRAQAKCKLHQYDKAKHDLLRALKLEPENKAVWNQVRAVDEAMKKEKQMYQKMFSS